MIASNTRGILPWKRLILLIAVLLTAQGILSWFNIPREEDPRLRDRHGIIKVIFPGATSVDVRRLVADRIEDELSSVDGILNVTTRVRAEFALLEIELKDSVESKTDVDKAWDDVKSAMEKARTKFPEGVWAPELDRELFDQDAVLLALTGDTANKVDLVDQARVLKDRLLSIPWVKRVNFISSPGEQVTVELDDRQLKNLGLPIAEISSQLSGANASLPSGNIRIDDRKVNVLTNSSFSSVDEVKRFPIALKSGEATTLGDLGSVTRTEAFPVTEAMFYKGKPAMGIGVVPVHDVDLQRFGKQVRDEVADFNRAQAGKFTVEEISYQPAYVDARIFDIAKALLKAIFLVGGILMLLLGVRVGTIVAFQVPIVSAIALGLYAGQGGVLHQISMASFILAVGLLVDNVVVIVDGIQKKLDEGLQAVEAAEKTIKEFWVPLLAGTLTAISAFVPLLFAKGKTADFVRSIGEVSLIALASSYFFCIFVTPILCAWLLRSGRARPWAFTVPVGAKLGGWVVRYPKRIIGIALVLVAVASVGFIGIQKQFFPLADRNQLVVGIEMPEGTHFTETLKVAKEVEAALTADKRVVKVSTFVGRGTPFFYYNLPRQPNAPHIAQLIVQTEKTKQAKELRWDSEGKLKAIAKFGELFIKEIEQGPPVKAPIEVRVSGVNREAVADFSDRVLDIVRSTPGTRTVRSDRGIGQLNLRYAVDDRAVGLYGITRKEISAILLGRTRGLPTTQFRGGADPYPVVLRSSRGEFSDASDLQQAYVGQTRTRELRINEVSSQSLLMQPSVMNSRNRVPTVSVLAELDQGWNENNVAKAVRKSLSKLTVPEGIHVELGGIAEESQKANGAIFAALPAGLFLLLISLLFEFNSFAKVAIILTTIPLCAVGTVPGLVITGYAFGFVTLMGCFVLAGTVIHNGIFLIDYVDHRLAEGIPMEEALTAGIQRRMRPILLTAIATIVELIPLTMTQATIWPPFAWAIISGLSISTLLTLLVVPSLYLLVFRRQRKERAMVKVPVDVVTALVVGVFICASVVTRAQAQETNLSSATKDSGISLSEVIERARSSYDAKQSGAREEAKAQDAKTAWRAAWLPKVGTMAEYEDRDRTTLIESSGSISVPVLPMPIAIPPMSAFRRQSWLMGVEVRQNLFQPSLMLHGIKAAEMAADAQRSSSKREVQEAQFRAVDIYLQIHDVRAKRKALSLLVKNLRDRQNEIRRFYDLGRVSESDVLRIKLGIDDASEGEKTLAAKESVLELLLGRALGSDRPVKAGELEEIPKGTADRMLDAEPQPVRSDIRALEIATEAVEAKRKSIIDEHLPEVSLFGRYNYSTFQRLTEQGWFSAGVRASWTLFDGATRYSRAAAASAERTALEYQLLSARQGVAAQMRDATSQLKLRDEEIAVRDRGLKEAERNQKIQVDRYRKGKITLNELIDAEDILKDRREKADLVRIGWYQEWFRLHSARGDDPALPGAGRRG